MPPALKPRIRLVAEGPQIAVTVRHHPVDAAEMRQLGQSPGSMTTTLLIDTGAAHTVIDEVILAQIGVVPFSTASLISAAGITPDCPVYMVELALALTGAELLVRGPVIGLPGRFPAHFPYRGILGRSSLQGARFIYDGPTGTFTLEAAAVK